MEQLGKLFEKEVSYLWRNHIPVAMPVMISAREGDGKSTTCIQIAKEILDENPKAYIAWIASEGFVSDTINKMEQLGVDQKRFLLLRNSNETFQFDFQLSSDLKQLDAALNAFKKKNLNVLAVFIDSIRGISRFDDNESKIKTVMLPLNGIVCDKYGCSLIYIDHFKKGIATNLLDKVVGSTAKAAAVRCVYAITPVGGLVRKISVAKTNILNHRPDELRTTLRGGKGLLIYECEQPDHTLRDEAQEWLIALFSKQAEYRASEIYSLGEHDSFGISTLKTAKQDLGIDSKQEAVGKPWNWICYRFLDE
jgi:archaellum biogenesis ATPase FlaH